MYHLCTLFLNGVRIQPSVKILILILFFIMKSYDFIQKYLSEEMKGEKFLYIFSNLVW